MVADATRDTTILCALTLPRGRHRPRPHSCPRWVASRRPHPREPRRGPPVLRRDPSPRRVEPDLPIVAPEHGDRTLVPGRDPLSTAHRRGDGGGTISRGTWMRV